ncbi:MAG: hypothetical protein B6245_02605 [Desulfobacteraceae bacterium 4572_88]|nr:MAG: hypothetical protein B6245_02605 [Desulfobacteraceae bacterium 4572_88]RLC21594.1 MAG: hypothetical protein DRI57_01965 [Deltaproteobacteria bacterium]
MNIPFMNNRGTTLFELLAAMTMIAVVGAVVTSLVTLDDSNQANMSEKLKNHLRYAQSLSLVNDDYHWEVVFAVYGGSPPDEKDSYSLWKVSNSDPANKQEAKFPNARYYTEDEEDDGDREDSHTITIASNAITSGGTIKSTGDSVSFDNWGSPGTATQTIELFGTAQITITKYTGYIP